jgi:hypothetical protein
MKMAFPCLGKKIKTGFFYERFAMLAALNINVM